MSFVLLPFASGVSRTGGMGAEPPSTLIAADWLGEA